MLKIGQIPFLYSARYGQMLIFSNTFIRFNYIVSHAYCSSGKLLVTYRPSTVKLEQYDATLKNKRFYSVSSSNPIHQPQQNNDFPQKENGRYKVATIPNFLCVARIGLTPVIGYLVMQHQFCPAFALFAIAGFTDLLDGFIARNVAGQKSLLGSVLDPMADKLLISCMFITMTQAGLIPLPLTAVVILRDVCLIIGGFYKRYRSMDPPCSINRFFNPEVSSVQIVPTWMSKINTVFQLSLVAASLASPVFQFGAIGEKVITGLCWTTSITTVYSGLQYMRGNAFKKIR